jgi:hypothetical protein
MGGAFDEALPRPPLSNYGRSSAAADPQKAAPTDLRPLRWESGKGTAETGSTTL